MNLFVQLGIAVGIYLINKYVLAQTPPAVGQTYLDDAPTVSEGDPIPLVFGRTRVRSPVFMWYGGFQNRPPLNFSGSGGGPLAPNTTGGAAATYGVNMLFNVGIPMGPPTTRGLIPTKLTSMWVGDQQYNFTLVDRQQQRFVDVSTGFGELFDAIPNTNLCVGLVTFYSGGSDQQISNNVSGGIAESIYFTSSTSFNYIQDIEPISIFMRGTSNGANTATSFPGRNGIDGTTIPGYRNQMLVALTGAVDWQSFDTVGCPVFDAFYMGGDPHILPFSFEVQSHSSLVFNSGWAALPDADPVSVIYDLLTGDWGKIGIDPARINLGSFDAASATLLSEGNGYSRTVDQLTNAKDVLTEVVGQISGVLYEDPVSGLVTLKLIRADYTIGTLPAFTASDIIFVDDYTTSGWRDVINQVRVTYTDRGNNYANGDAFALNSASATMQDTVYGDASSSGGNIRSVTVAYPGCCTFPTATALAARDLNLLSQPLASLKITFTRAARNTRPGDVIVISFPDYYINSMVVRVQSVDIGASGAGQVQITGTQDAFANGLAVSLGTIGLPPIGRRPSPSPVTVRKLLEAPRWLQAFAINSGFLDGSPDLQRMIALAVPDDGANSYQAQSLPAIALLLGVSTYSSDVVQTNAATISAKVHTFYPQELGPYDTTTGLVIDSFSPRSNPAAITASTWSRATIQTYGPGLILVDDEIMAYESAVDQSGVGTGPWQLVHVWRGLLDTAVRDHAVGAPIFWIGSSYNGGAQIGKLGKPDALGSPLVQINARLGLQTGSGEDPIDLLTVIGRHARPLPVANLRLEGEVMSGTQPTPTISNGVVADTGFSGWFAKVASMEEGFNLTYQKRDRLATLISRGDEPPITLTETVTFETWAQKTATTPGETAGAEYSIDLTGSASQMLLGGVGYGDIDVIEHSRKYVSGSANGGDLVTITEFQEPRVHVFAPRWRNLLGNVRFLSATVGPVYACWALGGTAVVSSTRVGPSRATGELYGTTSTGASTPATFAQTIDLTNWNAKGQSALVDLYCQDVAGGGSASIKIETLNNAGTTLTSSTSSLTLGTTWTNQASSLNPFPVGTVSVRVTVTLTPVSGKNGSVCFCEPRLRVGAVPVTGGLSNASFETGPGTTSWTNVTNSFVANGGAVPGASPNYVCGGAFATSEIRQDVALSAFPGYEVGSDAVLTYWGLTHFAGDSGTVTLSCLNGSTVVATTSASFSYGVVDVWNIGRLSLPVPEGTTIVRVDLLATRTAGSGNSGACFDEFALGLWKDLGDARAITTFDYSKATTQPIAGTWQEWHVEHGDLYRAGVPHPLVFGGAQPSSDGGGINAYALSMAWSDGLAHATGIAVGQWGGVQSAINSAPNASIASYAFSRGGVCFQGTDSDNFYRVAAPDGTYAFTAMVLLRIDEDSFAGACGLFGRRSVTVSAGWQLELDATGHVTATVIGAGGSATATRSGSTVVDGGWHLAAMVFDPIAATLTVYDERGSQVTSSVSVGSMTNTDWAALLMLGKSRSTVDSMPGQIARAYWFNVALTGAQIAAHWNYAKDPTGTSPTYTCPSAGWVAGALDTNGNETIVCMSSDQVSQGYAPANGGVYGLVTSPQITNNCPSWDFTSAPWAAGSGTTLTQGIVDATGQSKGVQVFDGTGGGIALSSIPMSASARKTLVIWTKCDANSNLDFELLNSSLVVKQTVTMAVGTGWARTVVSFNLWDASTASGVIKIVVHGGVGASFNFYLSHIVHIEDGTTCAPYIPRLPAATTTGSTFVTLTANQLAQFNSEGEIETIGVAAGPLPDNGVGVSICAVDNGTFAQYREVGIDASSHPILNHFDASSANVVSQSAQIDWSQAFDVRGRWSYTGLLDTAHASLITAGIVTLGSTNSSVYGRTATFTYGTTKDTRIRVGAGSVGGFPGFLSKVIARAREQLI